MSQTWISTSELRAQEAKERGIVDAGSNEPIGDFGAYYLALKGDKSMLRLHSLCDPETARPYVLRVVAYLSALGLQKNIKKIADIASGEGTILNEFVNEMKLVATKAFGIELSQDASALAKKQYPQINFICESAEKVSELLAHDIDLIHAREFYPFTRVNDLSLMLTYLRNFASVLNQKQGVIALMSCHNTADILDNWGEIQLEMKRLGYSCKKVPFLPNAFGRAPLQTLCQNGLVLLTMSYLVSLLRALLGKKPVNLYLVYRA